MKTISIRVSDHEHLRLIHRAEKYGTTVSDLIRESAKKVSNDVEAEIKKAIIESESRTAERIADFRKNLVVEFSVQQKKMKRIAEGYDEE